MTDRRWELKLSYLAPPLSMNARMHWAQQNRIKDELQSEVGWLLKQQKVPALDRAWIWLDWTPNTVRRRDTDNCEPTRKAVIDAIVRAGLLSDDTTEFVRRPENVIRPSAGPKLGELLVIITDHLPASLEGALL